jgi:hypothetical protein
MDGLEQQLEAEAGVVYVEERRLARSPYGLLVNLLRFTALEGETRGDDDGETTAKKAS